MPSRQPQAGSTLIWLFVWIVGTAAIAYWCATRHVPAVQQQIQLNAEAAVSSVVMNDVTTSVYGRTVTLNGSVANESQKSELLSALSAADGIRHINDDQLAVVGSDAATTQSSETLVENTSTDNSNSALVEQPGAPAAPADSPTLSEPTSDTDSPAQETPIEPIPAPPSSEGPSSATQITESPSPEAPSAEEPSPDTAGPTPPNPPSPESPTPEITPAEPPSPVTPTSEPPSPEAPSSAPVPSDSSSSVASTTPDENVTTVGALAELAVADEAASSNVPDSPSPEADVAGPALVDVLEGDSSTFSMQIKDDTLTLTGNIASEGDALAFIQSAMKTFDVNYVVNSMQVKADSAKASWLPALTEFLPNMQPISDANIEIVESQITLSGIAPDAQTHNKIIDQALSLLSELSLFDNIIYLSTDNPAASTTANVEPEPEPEPTIEPAPTGTEPQENMQNIATPASAPPNAEKSVTSTAELSTLREAFKALEAEKVSFRSGSDVLTDESVQTVAAMSALLSKYTDINIEIDGHTDSAGSSEENLQLSQLRANAVRDLMIKRGIARERLSAYGFGDGIPIADNSTAAGRKLNRRIEFNF